MFFDSHCHLDLLCDQIDIGRVLERAKRAGVLEILVPGVSERSWQQTKSVCLSDHLIKCYPSFGLHPCFMDEHDDQADLDRLECKLAEDPALLAVGECGLDLFIENAQLSRQIFLFEAQVDFACRFDKPLVIHARRAVDQVLKVLRGKKPTRGGVVHAFSGSYQQASQLWDLGFSIGIGGSVTYERAHRLRAVVQKMPCESILLETDAPDMPLFGYQGLPNEPSQLRRVAQVVAELRRISIEEVGLTSTRMAQSLFIPNSE